jgi:hydrocephalus-inducing protein
VPVLPLHWCCRCCYHRYCCQVLPLEVNGLYRMLLTVTGEGTPLRVELATPAGKAIGFGAVPLGSIASRTLKLANRGRAAAVVDLAPSLAVLERHSVSVVTAAPLMLQPRDVGEVTLFYR